MYNFYLFKRDIYICEFRKWEKSLWIWCWRYVVQKNLYLSPSVEAALFLVLSHFPKTCQSSCHFPSEQSLSSSHTSEHSLCWFSQRQTVVTICQQDQISWPEDLQLCRFAHRLCLLNLLAHLPGHQWWFEDCRLDLLPSSRMVLD